MLTELLKVLESFGIVKFPENKDGKETREETREVMNKRATKKFTVAEICDKCVWLRLEEGEKSGLQFAISFDNGYQDGLRNLNEGEKITATLESMNEKDTAWQIINIQREENGIL